VKNLRNRRQWTWQ